MSGSDGCADDELQDPTGTRRRREPVAASELLSLGENDEPTISAEEQEHPCPSMRDNNNHNNNRSVLDDSLLVDHQETLHEIPVTPVKRARARPPNGFDGESCEEQEEESYSCLEVIEEEEPKELQVGDHVYQWRRWMGIPGVFQHHGIVMDIIHDGDETKLTIADFSNVPTSAKQRKQRRGTGLTQEGILRTYTDANTKTEPWHKVDYEAPWWKRQVYRAGTCTSIPSDAIGLVLARVNFIIHHPDVLPDYHVVYANCECVAFWCKTGKWSTLQASSFLELTAAGQVKSTSTMAAMAANTQVTIPASGAWGWFGYTSQVSYLSLHPMLLPALAGYAVVTVGAPAVLYVNARGRWKGTSQRLCDAFWESAMEHPDVFAECITHWSDKR